MSRCRLSEQCAGLLSHLSNRFAVGRGVVRCFVGPQPVTQIVPGSSSVALTP
jgi:hypothetical protein